MAKRRASSKSGSGPPATVHMRRSCPALGWATMRPLDVLRSWAVQDSPPGAAIAAVVARVPDTPVGWLDEAPVVALYNPRTATAVVPDDEVAAYGTAFLRPTTTALKAIVDSRCRPTTRASRSRSQLAVDAISDALDGKELSRDDLHEQLRKPLPGELLPWCEGCQSHHARRGLLVMAALNGRLCISGRAGRQPAFSRTDQRFGWDPPPREEAGAELVRRYRRTYGATSVAHFADWAGLGRAHAQAAVGAGRRRPAPTRARRRPPARARRPDPARPRPRGAAARSGRAQEGLGVAGRDGDRARRRRAGRALARAQEGQEARGLRRGAGEAAAETEIETQLERLAPHRGCTSVVVSFP